MPLSILALGVLMLAVPAAPRENAALAVAPGQGKPVTALTSTQRAHLSDERFQLVTSTRGLPLGVREALQKLFGTPSLDIAEPGAAFQATDVITDPQLPRRRLVAAGCSGDHCVVYYERGGFTHMFYAALFHWTPEATRLEIGGAAPGALKTVEEVRRAFLAGEIKTDAPAW